MASSLTLNRIPERRFDTEQVLFWKRAVLEAAANTLTNPRLPEIQKEGALWKWSDKIPYPNRHDIRILDDGSLNFDVDVGAETVLFSAWIMIGEIRVGVKLPTALLGPGAALRDKLSKIYDGDACPRIVQMDQAVMYDWIWKNTEFADFDFMVSALRDHLFSSVIADRLASIITHLYMATINTVVDGHGFNVAFRRITKNGWCGKHIHVTGDRQVFERMVTQRGYIIDERMAKEDGSCVYRVLARMPASPLAIGRIRDDDGGECSVLTIQDAADDNLFATTSGNDV